MTRVTAHMLGIQAIRSSGLAGEEILSELSASRLLAYTLGMAIPGLVIVARDKGDPKLELRGAALMW